MAQNIEPYRNFGGGGAISSASEAGPSAIVAVGDRLNLRILLSLFRRRFKVFLAVLLATILLAGVVTFFITPKYTGMAQVSLLARLDQITPVNPTTDAPPQQVIPSDSYVDTQVQVLMSKEMAIKVAKKLNLDKDPRFTTFNANNGRLGKILTFFHLVAPPRAATPYEALDAASNYLMQWVQPSRVTTSYALEIDFEDPDPHHAQLYANTYADEYTAGKLTEKQQQAVQEVKLVEQRMLAARSVAEADADAVQNYRNANNLLTTTGASLTEQEISAYNQASAAARAEAAEDEARLNTARTQLSNGSNGEDVGEALGSPVVSALRTQQAQIATNLADLTSRYGPRHPDVIKARSQLATINNSIHEEINRVISNLAAKVRVSQGRVGSLQSTLGGAQGNLAQNNRALPQLNNLQKRADASEALYESYLARYKDMTARLGTEQAEAEVLNYASLPTFPSFPNLLLVGALAVGAGIVLGVAAAFASEMAFAGLTTGDDVEQRLGVHFMGSVPALSTIRPRAGNEPLAAMLKNPRSAFAESFRGLRASIHFAHPGPGKVIAITSALPKEGKTTTAICLARSMALAGDRVVLVDADLRRHGLSELMREEAASAGLSDVLRGDSTLDDALIRDPAVGMDILRASREDGSDAELMTGDKMDALLAILRERYDAVIIDTAPILPIADARLMLEKADVAVFTVRWRKTPDHAVRAAFRLLPVGKVQLAGVALTQVDMRRQVRFGYGDDTFYYGDYKDYYG